MGMMKKILASLENPTEFNELINSSYDIEENKHSIVVLKTETINEIENLKSAVAILEVIQHRLDQETKEKCLERTLESENRFLKKRLEDMRADLEVLNFDLEQLKTEEKKVDNIIKINNSEV